MGNIYKYQCKISIGTKNAVCYSALSFIHPQSHEPLNKYITDTDNSVRRSPK